MSSCGSHSIHTLPIPASITSPSVTLLPSFKTIFIGVIDVQSRDDNVNVSIRACTQSEAYMPAKKSPFVANALPSSCLLLLDSVTNMPLSQALYPHEKVIRLIASRKSNADLAVVTVMGDRLDALVHEPIKLLEAFVRMPTYVRDQIRYEVWWAVVCRHLKYQKLGDADLSNLSTQYREMYVALHQQMLDAQFYDVGIEMDHRRMSSQLFPSSSGKICSP